VGFSLSEGIIRLPRAGLAGSPASRRRHRTEDVAERAKADRLQERRRHIAGPTGCGLCGIESVAEAMRPAAIVGTGRQFSSEQIMTAMRNISSLQKLNIETRAVHAARFGRSAKASLPCARTLAVTTRLTSSRVHYRAGRPYGGGDYPSHQSDFSGDGTKERRHRRNGDGIGFGADSVGRAYGACRRYHACRHCSRRRIRGVHASLPDSVWSDCRRCGPVGV